ncbi:MAG: hypothetical protein ACR2NZ_19415, partial [Rubripirellula sp.]
EKLGRHRNAEPEFWTRRVDTESGHGEWTRRVDRRVTDTSPPRIACGERAAMVKTDTHAVRRVAPGIAS